MDFSSRDYQLVVIAKPSPDQPYCRLASAFQSCSCSQSILQPCLNALRAFCDERNRVGILQELEFAAQYQIVGPNMMLPAEPYYQVSKQEDADCRFPYITATLVSGMASSCLDQGHAGYRCSLETPFHAVKSDFILVGDPLYEHCNRNIIVGVVDITDLRMPRYCFLNMDMMCLKCGVQWYDLQIDINDELRPRTTGKYTPLSSTAFSSRTAFDSDGTVWSQREAQDFEALEALQIYPLVDVAALASCWPSTAWNPSGQLEADPEQASLSIYQRAPNRGVKSFGELVRNKILDAILSELLDDLDLLDQPMLCRGFPRSFLAICAARADELAAFKHQETIAELIARLLEGADHVDLYEFRQLPMRTILQVLHSDRLKAMKSLNLSGLFVGSTQQIWTTIETIPHQLDMIYLLSPPSADMKRRRAEIINAIPNYTGRNTFWDRVGSKKIIMSASISKALVSYGSPHRSNNNRWEHTYLSYLREVVSGDIVRL